MRPKQILVGFVTLVLAGGLAVAQDAPAGLQTGPATVAPHWTKNTGYPTSIPEGAAYHIVTRGDTLWDLAAAYLKNPYLWPQIWDANKYIADAHWIYPGDPVILPKLAVLADQAGQAPAAGAPEGVGEGEPLPEAAAAGEGEGAAAALGPVTEEITMQCAPQIVTDREDESLMLVGSELGGDKIALADRDLVYLNKGSNSGVKPGDLYSLHHVSYTVKHPVTRKKLGTKIETTGWVKVVTVDENTACAVVEQACHDIHAGDYLRPFEKVNVPMVVKRATEPCCAPSNGKLNRHIVDLQDDAMIGGQGHLVAVDAGTDDGVSPGSVFTVYRVVYPSVPTPRNVVGEVTVLSTQPRTSIAKITYSRQEVVVGDQIELR